MVEIFRGSDAVESGQLTEWQLRRWHRRLFRDVYVPKWQEVTIRERTAAAWLWSKRKAVIAGVAASALHGAEWIDANVPIELTMDCSRPPRGVIARDETIFDDEIVHIAGMPVTTPARTAFDLGRHLRRGEALARLDALMRAKPFSIEDVMLIAKRHRGARGLPQLRKLLPLVDGGAASPQETRLRLLFIDAGFPKPTTQIPVYDGGQLIAVLDMGWEELMVASEYDGEHHQRNRDQYAKDQLRSRKVAKAGWLNHPVIKEDRDDDVIARVYEAMISRGWRP